MRFLVSDILKERRSWLKFAEIFLLMVLTILGVFISLMVGLSWDEYAEFQTYRMNMAAIEGLLRGVTAPYTELTQYSDRYYGIGFHLITHSIGAFMHGAFGDLLPYSTIGSRLIWGHVAIFLAFIGSGIICRFCLVRLTGDQFISALGMFVFLLWPYFYGHSMINVKDVPFMFAWLCCTLQLLRIYQAPQFFIKTLFLDFALLGAMTGWLISIRVAGILIFIQYVLFGLFLIILHGYKQINKSLCLKLGREMISFVIAMMCTLFILYPITWHDPSQLFKAVQYMSSHPWLGDTLTAGEFIEPKTRTPFYIGSWLAVKLPAFALVGLVLTPLVFWKAFTRRQFSNKHSALLVLLLSVIIILSVLVLMRVSLYNELRQILFISAILLLIAIVSFYYISRSLSIAILTVTIGVMAVDNIKMNPYQYSYVNEIARNVPKGGLFETDYFGISVSETARWLNQSSIDGLSQCLYVPSAHLWDFEINPKKFPCVANFPGDLSLIKKPFLFFVQARSASSFTAPPWCHLLHLQSRNLPFSKTTLRMGELYECLPPP